MRIFWFIISHLGICFMEVYALTWAFWIAWFKLYGIIRTVYAILVLVLIVSIFTGGIRHCLNRGVRMGVALFMVILGFAVNMCTLWFFLALGILNGRIETAPDQHLPRRVVWRPGILFFRTRIFSGYHQMQESELPLHYRLGRWIYRRLYGLLTRIPGLQQRQNLASALARLIGMVIMLWGIWDLPHFLMN